MELGIFKRDLQIYFTENQTLAKIILIKQQFLYSFLEWIFDLEKYNSVHL